MTISDEKIERLRETIDAGFIFPENICRDLLDEVVRLRAYQRKCGELKSERISLEAENERLRAENAELRRHVKKMQDVICTEMTQEAQRLGLYEPPTPRTEDAKEP